MCQTFFIVVTVKKWLKSSVYIYESYRKIKTGVSLFKTTLYMTYLRRVNETWCAGYRRARHRSVSMRVNCDCDCDL